MGDLMVSVDFDREEGEPMGILTDEKLMVTRVQDGTLADGKIQLGDVMKKVNNYDIRDRDHFFQLLQRCYPTQLTFVRSSGKSEEMAASQLPQELEKMLQRRSGFDYILMDVDVAKFPGKPLGLTLVTRYRRVYVSGVRGGSIAESFFKTSDRVLILNGAPVSDHRVARVIIQQSMGHMQAVVERPASEAAAREVRQLEESSAPQRPAPPPSAPQRPAPPPSAPQSSQTPQLRPNDMPQDVKAIVEQERLRRRSPSPAPGQRAILLRTPSLENIRVTLNPNAKETPIASDVDPNKILRPAPNTGGYFPPSQLDFFRILSAGALGGAGCESQLEAGAPGRLLSASQTHGVKTEG